MITDDDILEKVLSESDAGNINKPSRKKQSSKAFKKNKKRFFTSNKLWLKIASGIIILVLAGGIYYFATQNNNQQQTAQSEQEPTVYQSGTYLAGEDIEPGVYFVSSSNSNSYVQVSTTMPANIDSIIMNDNFSTYRYVQVEKGEYITLENASMTPADESHASAASDGNYYDGMYHIGTDIQAGTYEFTSTETDPAYVEILKDASGTFDSIITNASFTGTQTFLLEEGQYEKITRCVITETQTAHENTN